MTVRKLKINGTTHLCVVTPHENSRINAGQWVNIPQSRRVKKQVGIPLAIQLHTAGIIVPAITY